ncbi:MAG: hypothetical protein P8Y12_07825 [Gammaproteobacteria bacterium]|jgi:uncharacterized protein YpbB
MNDDIIEILIHNFADEKSLTDVREDYEDLELIIERERSANGEESRRLAALKVLAQFQLKLVLDKLAESPDKPLEPVVSTK